MKRKNTTRSALLTSIISLLLCVSMLVGTTFAWFTDEVKSGTNLIAAGNLDVDVYTADGKSIQDQESLFDEIDLWEPGVVAYENLTVANLGSLALKYQLAVNFTDATTNAKGQTLAKVLKVGFVEGGISGYSNDAAGRTALVNKLNVDDAWQSLESFVQSGKLLPKEHDHIKNAPADAAVESETYGIVIYWQPSDIDNEFNMNNENRGKVMSIKLGIKLLATQLEAEDDSFDETYDEDAWHPEMQVFTADDLNDALANGYKAILMDNIVATESVEIPAGVKAKLDLNGKTISGNGAGAVLVNNGTLDITGGKLENATINGASVINNKGTLTLDDVSIVGASIGDGGYPHYAVTNSGILTIEEGTSIASDRGALKLSDAGKTVINGGTFIANDIDRTLTSHVVVLDEYVTHELTINGGTFKHMDPQTSGGVVICNRTKNTVYVNGGNFSGGDYYGNNNLSDYGYGGTFSVTGGTYDAKPAAKYIAAGHTTVMHSDGTCSVVPEVENVTLSATEFAGIYAGDTAKTYYVFNKTGLMNLNNLFKSIYSGEGVPSIVNLEADVDLSGEDWKPLDAMWITFNGNGHTISNLTASGMDAAGRRSGFWAYAGGVIINDLTLENVTVNGSQAGIFAAATDGTKINNCFLKGNNVVNFVAGVEEWNGIGAICGIASTPNINVTIVDGATVTLNRGNMVTALGCTYIDDLTGHIGTNSGTITNNGTVTATGSMTYAVSNAAELKAAVNGGAKNVLLKNGEYDMPDFDAKANGVTFKGESRDGVKIHLNSVNGTAGDFCLNSITATLENLTVETNLSHSWAGFQNAANLTFNNCKFINNLFTSGNATFNECEFEVTTNSYNVWTYTDMDGAYTVEFNKCTFNSTGKAIYVDGNAGKLITVKVNDCIFNDDDTCATDKAAIETGKTYGWKYEIIITGSTFNGFTVNPTGLNTNSVAWANKHSMTNDQLNVVIDGVDVY